MDAAQFVSDGAISDEKPQLAASLVKAMLHLMQIAVAAALTPLKHASPDPASLVT